MVMVMVSFPGENQRLRGWASRQGNLIEIEDARFHVRLVRIADPCSRQFHLT
jgi:hypothetical protein